MLFCSWSTFGATIYYDDFSGSGGSPLNGAAPTTRPGSETWIAGTRWMADGTIPAPTGQSHAFLPFTPVAGYRYTLSADVNTTAGGADWIALGFSAAATTTGSFQGAPNNPVGWMLLRQNRGAAAGQSFLGIQTQFGAAHDTPAGMVNLQVILDTTRPMWTVQWFVNGTAVRGPLQFSGSNPSISYVGLGVNNTAVGTVDNLSLTSAPDPTTFLVNPSFENNTFAVSPGQVVSNTAITGWSVRDTARGGLNPAGGANAIAQNGAVPDGTNVLWLQATNLLSTVLNGLTPGTTYTLNFRANAKTASGTTNRPNLRVALDNSPGLFDAAQVNPVGGANPYHYIALDFTASSASHTLYITNDQATTNYLLLDNFSINVSTTRWSYAIWTNDASSGVDNSKNYTHAYNFGGNSAPDTTINGVTFRGIVGANPSLPGELLTSGLTSAYTSDDANVVTTNGGGSANLAKRFVYSGNPAVFAIQGLVPGRQYVATIYGVGWEAKSASRPVTWVAGSDRMSINEDQFDNNYGIRVSYAYTAPASGVMYFTNFPIIFTTSIATFHTYGLANYEAVAQNEPVIGLNPQDRTAVPGSMVSFSGTAGGARPLSYRWLSNGVEVAGQTNRYLTLTNVDASAAGTYALWVSNSFGMATSAVANLTIDTAFYTIVNPSFEMDFFPQPPGAINGNQTISGWTANDPAKAGLNPAGGLFSYANNGAVPDGQQVAWLAGGSGTLSTLLSGLTPGENYRLNFRVNGNASPNLRVALDGTTIMNLNAVKSVGGTNPYVYVACHFNASSETHTLWLTNDAAAATYVLLDDFSLSVSNSGWSYALWVDDATSGVDGSKVYTHAYNFHSSFGTTINGVFFNSAGANVLNPSRAGDFGAYSTMGLNTLGPVDANTITTNGGGSAALAVNFLYSSASAPESITISNLIPGVQYVATIYGVAFDNLPNGRTATFEVGADRMTINENTFDNNNGIRVSYTYTADASGTITLTYVPLGTPSFHTYGFSNYELASTNLPTFYAKPSQTPNWIAYGSSLSLSNFVVGGQQPITYQWQLNGADLPDQTNAWLNIENAGDGNAGTYTLVASNAQGIVTLDYVVNVGYISNPSFEADLFAGYPGYISGNAPITGWAATEPTKSGINPANGTPFANNGLVPDGSQVAFLQSTSSLSTVLGGLIPGTKYTVNFRINARNGQTPNLHVAIDDQEIVGMLVSSVGGTNAYKYAAFDFTAANGTHLLSLTNDAAGDNTALIDDFRINVSTSQWSYALWVDDASSGVDGTKFYSHAYNFGTAAADTTINGVKFTGVPGANPSVPGKFGSIGLGSLYGDDPNALTLAGGGSAELGRSFVYGGASQSITLSNLVPGMEYVATIYGVSFGAGYRSATFSADGDRQTINEHVVGNDNGIAVSYRYVADASGTKTLAFVPTAAANTFHTYGFANRVAVDSAPMIVQQPVGGQYIHTQDSLTLSVGVGAGTMPMFYQWQLNGVNLPDQTNATLVVNNAPTGTNGYSVIITNSQGATTSSVASVVVGLPISELFNTGVNDDRTLATGGSVDAHWRMIQSDDTNYPGPAALVLHDAYPVQAGTYMLNGPSSKWISASTNGNSQPGNYTYRTTFLLDTHKPDTARITGKWAMDNNGVDILLNGVSLGISNNTGFNVWGTFVISNGFVAGLNTLDMVISNAPPAGWMASRAEFYGVAEPLAPIAPQILNQPQGLLVQELQNANFEAVAVGSGPLSYQWYYEGFDLPNETNRTLRLTSVANDQEGSYWVVVSNSLGMATSAVAVLTVNQAPIVANEVAGAVQDRPLTFTTEKLLANDEDFDGDTLAILSVSAHSLSNGVVTLSNNVVTYTPPAGWTGQDWFSYLVNDGQGGSATGLVAVTVGPSNLLNVVSPPALLPNGHFQVGFAGIPYYTYTVERATSVQGPWQAFTNATAGANGQFMVVDPNDPPASSRFYRTLYP